VLLDSLPLSTRAAVFSTPLTLCKALGIAEGWLDQPAVTGVHQGRRNAVVIGELLCSSGADFLRFPGVRWIYPLR
jgi:hypothetical protein